ncbi:hypothetical protein AVEN_111390-1 [Araneus ventricosus]|uniref:Uncharacterized protein n=1 Tax=Araneus ventricosus TaxID=182803 RepID=A0A4Y2AJ73_ARAVE|nr:hypothetical protein AVEN_51305-1 [Araneus ventricosus]GBL79296.1 hypothetical protein AVEN_111390-1 [Araneus ventricosus]
MRDSRSEDEGGRTAGQGHATIVSFVPLVDKGKHCSEEEDSFLSTAIIPSSARAVNEVSEWSSGELFRMIEKRELIGMDTLVFGERLLQPVARAVSKRIIASYSVAVSVR